jgi:hypothetical protein
VRKQTFGFVCGEFSIALSGNDVVMPGSKNQPLKRSLLPTVGNINDAAGLYTLRAKCEGTLVCDMPVHVVWVTHASQAQSFLGFKSDNPQELHGALAVYVGKRVELEFVPENGNP